MAKQKKPASGNQALDGLGGMLSRQRRFTGPVILLAIVLAGLSYANYAFFRVVPQEICGDVEPDRREAVCASEPEELFKYGSLGSEATRGVPYTVFHVLPRVFPELMPGPGGFRSFGMPWEEGRELPVGFSKKTMGFPRITQNCALCHTATYRTSPEAKPVIVPTGPSHTTDMQAFLTFLEKAANDPRFSADVMLPQIEQAFDLSPVDSLMHRFLIIPLTRTALQEQAERFAWAHGRTAWGPGRDDPMNLTKLVTIDAEDDGTTGHADFPSIWNQSLREGQSMNWAGEARDPLAVYIDAALGLGAPPGPAFMKQMTDLRAYLRSKEPPPYPFPINRAMATRGEAIFNTECGACHGWDGPHFGKVIPISEIGTDRERFDTWRQEHADAANKGAAEMGVTRQDMVKDVGYASQPLDGIWLRAPYLHNGSVPNMQELLLPPGQRSSVFHRGCDIYDDEKMGFFSFQEHEDCPGWRFDTAERGNGNGGHDYGTRLTPGAKLALIEYLKTL